MTVKQRNKQKVLITTYKELFGHVINLKRHYNIIYIYIYIYIYMHKYGALRH